MKRILPLLALAAVNPAAAHEPLPSEMCDVVVTIEQDRALPRNWESEIAARLTTLGFAPEWACVVAPVSRKETPSGEKGATLSVARIGHLVEKCQSATAQTSRICDWKIEEDTAWATDGGFIHIQIHGSDFNTGR